MRAIIDGGREGVSTPHGKRLEQLEADRLNKNLNRAAKLLLWPLGALIAVNVIAGIYAHAVLL